MTPSAIWSLNASTAETPLATMSGTTTRRGLERRLAHRELDHLRSHWTGRSAAPRCGAPRPPTTRSAHPDTPAVCARARPDVCRASLTAGAVRRRTEACSRTGRLTKTAGVDPRAPRARCRRRGDTMMNPSTSRDRDSAGPHLLVRVLAGVHQEHLQIALPRRPLHGSHQRREVRIGDVGNDDGEIARPAGDQATGGPVRDEAERRVQLLRPCGGFPERPSRAR